MYPIIEEHREAIGALCREFGVAKLEVFGSVVTGAFDPERSDVEFIVTYPESYDFGPWLKRFFDFEQALARALQRDVDLIFNKPYRNRFFAREVDRTRRNIYDASTDTEAA